MAVWIVENYHDSPEVVAEIDTFYQDGANISISLINAFDYTMLKLGGASKQELDTSLTGYRQAAAAK